MKHSVAMKNGWIYLIILLIAAFSVVLAALSQRSTADPWEELAFEALGDGDERYAIRAWQGDDETTCCVFLPAGALAVRRTEEESIRVPYFGTGPVKVEDIRMGYPYPAIRTSANGKEEAFSVRFFQSANIPALFLQTQSGGMDYIHARKGNREPGNYAVLAPDAKQTDGGSFSALCGRGNTSWTDCEKKGYKILFDAGESLFGMPSSDEYVLLANARSNYLSNAIAFLLEKQIGIRYVSDSVFVDLYLNGEYRGNYMICHRPRVGEDGIRISDLERENELANPGKKPKKLKHYRNQEQTVKALLWKNEPSDISGGYLIERDVPEYYEEEDCGFVTASGDHYVIKAPKYASVSEAEYLLRYMNAFHDAAESPDGKNEQGQSYADLADPDSFARKYALEEFLSFQDAGRSSAFYYKDADDVLFAGPGWDFEGAFLGNAKYLTKLNGTPFSTGLYEALLQHEDFRERVREVYRQLLRPAVDALLERNLDEMQRELQASAGMDEIRWGRESFAESTETIRQWITERRAFLDEHWNAAAVYYTVKLTSIWSNHAYLYFSPGERMQSSDVPPFTNGDAELLGWIDTDTGEPYDFDKPVDHDLTLEAVWSDLRETKAETLLRYASNAIPEIIFGAAFTAVFLWFIIQMRKEKVRRR